jgi:hypothetical protein
MKGKMRNSKRHSGQRLADGGNGFDEKDEKWAISKDAQFQPFCMIG